MQLIKNLLKKLKNAKIKQIKGDIPIITGLATTTSLNAVNIKMPGVSNLVAKKRNYNAKISDVQSKYFTTSNYNKFTNSILDAKKRSKNLVYGFDISGFVKNTNKSRIKGRGRQNSKSLNI